MEEKRSKNIVIIALCLTLIFMGVGFAALSQQLTITTAGEVKGSKWDINLSDFQAVDAQKVGGEQVTASVSDVSTTAVTLNFSLSKPGDKVVFTGKINNNGTLNAKLNTAIDLNTFDGKGYVTRTVTGAPTVKDTMLNAGNSVDVTITYEFTSNTLPDTDADSDGNVDPVKISDTLVFDYVQAD